MVVMLLFSNQILLIKVTANYDGRFQWRLFIITYRSCHSINAYKLRLTGTQLLEHLYFEDWVVHTLLPLQVQLSLYTVDHCFLQFYYTVASTDKPLTFLENSNYCMAEFNEPFYNIQHMTEWYDRKCNEHNGSKI